jgi:hypothetical protein
VAVPAASGRTDSVEHVCYKMTCKPQKAADVLRTMQSLHMNDACRKLRNALQQWRQLPLSIRLVGFVRRPGDGIQWRFFDKWHGSGC